MKTRKFLLPCIAAVAIATFVGAKSFKTNANESNELLLANVEALTNELEEVTITCGRVDGPCFFQWDLLIEPGNCHYAIYRYDCIATGDPNDYCGGVNPDYIHPC